MGIRKLTIIPLLTMFIAASVFAAYEVKSPGETVPIYYNVLDGAKIIVNTTKEYIPFKIEIRDLPLGYYTLDWDNKEALICAPTSFNITEPNADIFTYCIAKPADNTVEMRLLRNYNGSKTTVSFTIDIVNNVVWYTVFSGGVESGYYLSNGEYIIEHIPKRQLVSQIIVRKGNEVVFTGLMFPGQEEKVAEDLKIKFLGAIDNITYLKIYSTSDKKFTPIQVKPKVQVIKQLVKVYPECKKEDDKLIIKNTVATLFYSDNTIEVINATESEVIVRRPNIVAVVCGPIVKFDKNVEFGILNATKKEQQEQKQEKPQQPSHEEKPKFLTYIKSVYYTGEPVTITATAPFTISCTDGTNLQTDTFTKIFDEPATCVIRLGDTVKTIQIKPKQVQQPQPQQPKEEQQKGGLSKTGWYALALLILIAGIIMFKDKIKEFIESRKKESQQPQEESEENIDYEVKSSLEGEH